VVTISRDTFRILNSLVELVVCAGDFHHLDVSFSGTLDPFRDPCSSHSDICILFRQKESYEFIRLIADGIRRYLDILWKISRDPARTLGKVKIR
jgi:hypothetical protein